MAIVGTAAPAYPTELYVGDLDGEVVEGNLTDLFSQIGSVESVRICRDGTSGRSLGFGFVKFFHRSDAAKAMEALNYTKMRSKAIRIMWRLTDVKNNGPGNIFIKNLNESICSKKLHDTFIEFGNILSCKVASTEDGKSKGYGFIHFQREQDAKVAIEKMNGIIMEGKRVYVGKFLKQSERERPCAARDPQKFTNVYIKNLNENVGEEALRQIFSNFGEITSVIIMRNSEGISKGFGFINFRNPDHAKLAVEFMNGRYLFAGSKAIYVGRAQKKIERQQILHERFENERKLREPVLKYMASNVYVRNIDDAVNDETLRRIFGGCGKIISANVARDDWGRSKGFGFVCFSVAEEAQRAVANLSGYMLHGKPLFVAMAIGQPPKNGGGAGVRLEVPPAKLQPTTTTSEANPAMSLLSVPCGTSEATISTSNVNSNSNRNTRNLKSPVFQRLAVRLSCLAAYFWCTLLLQK